MKELGSKTAGKILQVFLDNPLLELKESDLIAKAKTGKGSASNTINNLIQENLLIQKRVGKTKQLKLNLTSPKVFFLKNYFDQKKLNFISENKLAALLFFRNEVKRTIKMENTLILVFGSTVSGTSTEKSDLDLLITSNNFEKIEEIRKKTEEIFGEKFNLHTYSELEIINKINQDYFIQNAFLKGALIHGLDLGKELFTCLSKKNTEKIERLFYFQERIKSALRNYLNHDYKAMQEILERLQEQITFYILTERNVPFASKKDAFKSIKRYSEGKIILKNNNPHKIQILENLIKKLITENILEAESYAKPRN